MGRLPKMKPCPFCGEEESLSTQFEGKENIIAFCGNCGAEVGPHKDDRQAIRFWNMREAPESIQKLAAEDKDYDELMSEADHMIYTLGVFRELLASSKTAQIGYKSTKKNARV